LFVQHGFQSVAVRSANERGVVAVIVVLTNARWPFIDTALAERLRVEAIDRLATWGNKGEMEASTRLRIGTRGNDSEWCLSLVSRRTVPDGPSVLTKPKISEGRETGVIEQRGLLKVLHADRHVIEYKHSLIPGH
jgi:hypothetical protein